MEIGISVPDTQVFVKTYTENEIILNTNTYHNSIVISPNKIINDHWACNDIKSLTKDQLIELFKTSADVYLIGTGKNQLFPDMKIYQFCQLQNKAVDFMNSNAACRTFNMLASEGRSIVAAIII